MYHGCDSPLNIAWLVSFWIIFPNIFLQQLLIWLWILSQQSFYYSLKHFSIECRKIKTNVIMSDQSQSTRTILWTNQKFFEANMCNWHQATCFGLTSDWWRDGASSWNQSLRVRVSQIWIMWHSSENCSIIWHNFT